VPAFPEATIGTRRLLLTPLGQGDADELAEVLADPELHRFIGGRPATAQELRDRYRALEAGSPRAGEVWRNWVVRRRADARPVGTVQATIGGRAGGWTAEIAWVVGVAWQGRGYASEAARALVAWLGRHDVQEIVAHIHPDHAASARVAARAGLRPTSDQVDGEQVWRHIGHGTAVWSSDAWRREAERWLDEQLAANRLQRTGGVTQPHLRPWATVLRAPTTGGTVWLKAAGPDTAFEVALYRLLEQVAPERILSPIAVDPERGWMVLPDGGTTLGERLDEVDLVEAMVTVLPQYGQLQRDLGPHLDDLLAFRMNDMRAAAMPASIGHNDLHFWNVFVAVEPGTGAVGRVRLYDWGDSVVAHPFASMLLGLGMLHLQLGVGADDPAVMRPRDAYLEVFGDLASPAELVELELACRVAKGARALSWDRALRMRGAEEAGEFADAPLQALRSLLSDSWIAAV
jgi:RimJ/RimL family protein N-acetyltransferase